MNYADEVLESTKPTRKIRTNTERFIYGAAIGTLATCVSSPFKIAAAQCPSFLRFPNYLRTKTKREGIFSLWTGNSTECLLNAPKSALRYLLFSLIRENVFREEDLNPLQYFFASSSAYSLTDFALFPLVVIRNRKTENHGLFRTFSDIVNNEGWTALYEGAVKGNVLRLPTNLSNNLIYSFLRSSSHGFVRRIATISLSTIVGTSLTYPFEVMSLAANSRNDQGKLIYKSLKDCIVQTIKNKSLWQLYDGLPRALLAKIPYAAVETTFFDSIEDTINHLKKKRKEAEVVQSEETEVVPVEPRHLVIERKWFWF